MHRIKQLLYTSAACVMLVFSCAIVSADSVTPATFTDTTTSVSVTFTNAGSTTALSVMVLESSVSGVYPLPFDGCDGGGSISGAHTCYWNVSVAPSSSVTETVTVHKNTTDNVSLTTRMYPSADVVGTAFNTNSFTQTYVAPEPAPPEPEPSWSTKKADIESLTQKYFALVLVAYIAIIFIKQFRYRGND
jgi:hypothetical protein